MPAATGRLHTLIGPISGNGEMICGNKNLISVDLIHFQVTFFTFYLDHFDILQHIYITDFTLFYYILIASGLHNSIVQKYLIILYSI